MGSGPTAQADDVCRRGAHRWARWRRASTITQPPERVEHQGCWLRTASCTGGVENRLGEVASSALVGEALDRAQRFLSELWAHPPRPPHLIHGDLTPDNILVDHGTLVPIDFQDLVWGLDIQDLAIVWSALAPFDEQDRLRDRFRAGYATVRPWPELDPETLAALIAARRLHQLNLALTLRKPGLADFVTRATKVIAEWMR